MLPVYYQAAAISGDAGTITGDHSGRGGWLMLPAYYQASVIFPADNSNAGEAGTITGDHSGRGSGYYFCNS